MKRAFWIMLAVLVVSIAINVWQWRHQPEAETRVEHDTVWRDSIIREPLPAETINTGKVVYIKIPVPGGRDTIRDSIEVPVQIQQKRYEDSLYTAWVSGYEPALDSINLRLPTITETVTKTVVKPSPLITFGVQVGGGYGVFNRQPDVYVGVGCQINLWRK
jgi:hypothetical protein